MQILSDEKLRVDVDVPIVVYEQSRFVTDHDVVLLDRTNRHHHSTDFKMLEDEGNNSSSAIYEKPATVSKLKAK